MGEMGSIEIAAKFPGYLALLVGTGAAVVLALASDPRTAMLRARVARIARAAGLVGVVAIVLRALAHAVTIDGPAAAVDLDTLRLVVVDSRWGASWRWHAVTAGAIALASWRLGPPSRLAPYVLALAAAVVVAPWLGHGAGSLWRGALHSLHLAVTGAWLGTVVVLALAARRASPILLMTALAPIVARFSPLALVAAALAGATGVVLAWIYLGGVLALVATAYGRLLLVKIGLVAAIGACGYFNWQRVRRGGRPRVGLIQAEAAFAVLTLVVTAWLTETEHP